MGGGDYLQGMVARARGENSPEKMEWAADMGISSRLPPTFSLDRSVPCSAQRPFFCIKREPGAPRTLPLK